MWYFEEGGVVLMYNVYVVYIISFIVYISIYFPRHFVDVILFNDAFGYMFLCIKLMNWATLHQLLQGHLGWDWALIAQYTLGVILCAFNYWAKV